MSYSQPEESFNYHEELPAGKTQIWALLENYSEIPSNQIEDHLRKIVSVRKISPSLVAFLLTILTARESLEYLPVRLYRSLAVSRHCNYNVARI
jgi:hypothetical protein